MPSPEELQAAQGLLRENRVNIDLTDGRNYVEIAQSLGYLATPEEPQLPYDPSVQRLGGNPDYMAAKRRIWAIQAAAAADSSELTS